MRVAVVLFNLGGPDTPDAVQPFLFNLFNDKAIIGAPNPVRWLLAKTISSFRASSAIENYNKMGGGSPLVPETEKQARALEVELSEVGLEAKCFLAMRYWKPFTLDAVKAVNAYNPEKTVLLPLYPQFSTTTTGSSLSEWKRVGGGDAATICCYPTQPEFIGAHADTLLEAWRNGGEPDNVRVLFSAHGLPEKVIESGDPYQWQVEQSAKAVVDKLNIKNLDWWVTYQSRVGPLEWIGPNTEDEILRAGMERIPLVIVPIAFVSEHSETLVELDIEYREVAEKNGVTGYFRTPTVLTHSKFINGLGDIVVDHINNDIDTQPEGHVRICPSTHKRCICKG